MKNKIQSIFLKQRFWTFLTCLFVFGLSNLHAQTYSQAEVAAAISSGTPLTGTNIIIPAMTVQNTGTAGTLTINATGTVTIDGLNLSGVAGLAPAGSSSAQRTGKNGHRLVITAGGIVTITGLVNTSGGNAVPPVDLGEFAVDREAGNGGNAGDITINADQININSAITANGGNAALPNTGAGDRAGGNGGNAGNVTINSQQDLTINIINVNGGNGSNNYMQAPSGAGGNAGNVTIESETNITTTGAITANAGNTGQNTTSPSNDAVNGVPLSKNGGAISINSLDGAVTIGGAITANGGNGTGQATNTMFGTFRNKASTDGGNGGLVNISSCGDLISTFAITVNGGLPGVPVGSPNGSTTFWNQAGSGGQGGTVNLTSNNSNVTIAQIQANGTNGQNANASLGGTNEGNSAPLSGRADHAGWGGNGGSVNVSALKGTLTTNNNITVNAGNGGTNNSTDACGGTGGDGGTIILRAAAGNSSAISALLAVNGGTKGSDTANDFQCTDGQAGVNGTATVVIAPYVPPTIDGQIDIECDENGIVVDETITRSTLDSYLSNYVSVPSERWEICLDGSTWNAITFPFTITDANKANYNGFLRLVYTECGVDKILEEVLISIPCLPVPPDPSNCPTLPNAIIWGGSNGENSSFLMGDSEIENLTIFNRFGIIVFEGGKGEGWDGTCTGNFVDPGTYYYVLNHSCIGLVKATIEVVKY